MTRDLRQHSQTDKALRVGATRTLPPLPISPAARAYAARLGSPLVWTSQQYKVYVQLGGIQ